MFKDTNKKPNESPKEPPREIPVDRYYTNFISAYVEQFKFTEATDKLYFWSAISALSGAIGHNIILRHALSNIPLSHYIVVVGPAGSRKGSCVGQAREALESLPKSSNVHFGAHTTTSQAIIDKLKAIQKDEYLWDVEKGKMTHSYLSILNPEFGVFFKKDDNDMVQFITDIWDLKSSFAKDVRKDNGEILVKWPSLNMLSATTPSWVTDNFSKGLAVGGLASRTIWVHEKGIDKLVPFPKVPENFDANLKHLYDDLAIISTLHGVMEISPEAEEVAIPWYAQASHVLKEGSGEEVEATFIARKLTHALKLASLFSIAEDDSLIISGAHMSKAMRKIDEVCKDMNFIFSGHGSDKQNAHILAIENKLRDIGRPSTENYLLSQMGRGTLANEGKFLEGLGLLIKQGLVYATGDVGKRKLTHVKNLQPQQLEAARKTNCIYHL